MGGYDPGEGEMRVRMKTDEYRGTYTRYIAPALNEFIGQNYCVPQTNPDDILSATQIDVDQYNVEVMSSMVANGLPNCQGAKATVFHTEVLYGYDVRGGGYLYYADVYDNHKFGSFSNLNTYGTFDAQVAIFQHGISSDGDQGAYIW